MTEKFRVTYATLSADNEDLHAAYDKGLEQARGWLGTTITPTIDGVARPGGESFEVTSPGDPSLVLCTVKSALAADVEIGRAHV